MGAVNSETSLYPFYVRLAIIARELLVEAYGKATGLNEIESSVREVSGVVSARKMHLFYVYSTCIETGGP